LICSVAANQLQASDFVLQRLRVGALPRQPLIAVANFGACLPG
jgi:hypothetical protein